MIRFLALALTVVTGFSALVYQVAWQKYLAVLLGSHSEATAAVLAIFLGGLSYGYALFGRLARRLAAGAAGDGRLLVAYGLVEAAIGVYAFAFPFLFSLARWLSLLLPQGLEGLAFATDVALSAALIAPPTILMGGTVPLLTQGLSSGVADSTRFHALVYAFNTAGAFVGALAGGLALVPWYGLQATVVGMGLVNLLSGLAFVGLGRFPGARATNGVGASGDDLAAGADDVEAGARSTYAIVALLSGFSMMALQTTANRIAAVSLGASQFAFSMVVATFVSCIAVGSLAVAGLPRVRPGYLVAAQWLLVAYLLALLSFVPDATYWAHAARSLFVSEPAAFYPFHLTVFAGLAAVLLVPLVLSGATLPLLFHVASRTASNGGAGNGAANLGAIAGRLYSWNTVGSLAGALLAGYALLFWLDLDHVYRLAVAALIVGAALITRRLVPGGTTVGTIAASAALLALVAQPAWSPVRLSAGLFQWRAARPLTFAGADAFFAPMESGAAAREVLHYDDDPTTSVAVIRTGSGSAQGERLALLANGKTDGNVPGDNVTMSMLSLVPALFAERAERAFVIGYGTGVSVGELLGLPSMEDVVVAEISGGVIDAAPHFAEASRGAADDAKTRLLRSDAYRALLRSEGRYDVIVSEPSNPWVAGVEMLLSREFLEAARGRLAPGGVYAQWFHVYAMDEATLSLVLNTYRSVFDEVSVWFMMGTDLLLLGFDDDHGDAAGVLERIAERLADDPYRSRFAAIGIDSLPALLLHELYPAGVVGSARLPAEVHTLLHPILSHRAARAYFVGADARFPSMIDRATAKIGRANSLLGALRASGEASSDGERTSMVEEACEYNVDLCATLFALWQHEAPLSRALPVALGQARQRYGQTLDPSYIAHLSRLFRADGTAAYAASYEMAYGVRELFRKHYYHGAPFDAEALHSLWHRCAEDSRCAGELDSVLESGVSASSDG